MSQLFFIFLRRRHAAISYLELNGFRGYNKKLRIDFAESFTIIDGRNGVGKSSIFDAIEFALTGNLRSMILKKQQVKLLLIIFGGEGRVRAQKKGTLLSVLLIEMKR
ncbi:AAA family ATPase [Thiohalophilus sp.]|uniref:AAA family ATPase n=1 Tax=Thiohalophilus sp. TaxID=3028392 RepID=UPI002ACD427A|nr:AAA family ATPase [Thiohalophilus sp.]MDZ7802975.1 AAA family ATPase [Thiohalophilus sp.]